MRFSIVAAALLSVVASVSAIGNDGGQKFQCGKITKISLKKFSFEKKAVAIVIKDKSGKELGRKMVEPDMDEVEMMMPESPQSKFAKLVFIDVKTNAEFANAQQIVIDCPKRQWGGGNNWEGGNNGGNNWDGGNNGGNNWDGDNQVDGGDNDNDDNDDDN